MRAELVGLLFCVGCATPAPVPPPAPPEAPPTYISPSQGQFQCVQSRGARKIEAQMSQIALETALRGISDVTCWHFKLLPGTRGFITLMAEQKLTADELFDAFVQAAAQAKISVKPEAPESHVYVISQLP